MHSSMLKSDFVMRIRQRLYLFVDVPIRDAWARRVVSIDRVVMKVGAIVISL